MALQGSISRRYYLAIGVPSLVLIPVCFGLSIGLLGNFLALCCIYTFVAAQVGRCRDIGLSIWWTTLTYVPLLQVFWWLWLAVLPGTVAPQTGRPSSSEGVATKRILDCPSCKRKVRVPLPPPGPVGKCRRCGNYFEFRVDRTGSLHLIVAGSSGGSAKTERHTYHSGDRVLDLGTIDGCLAVLDLDIDATAADIKKAYKEKMAAHHPDKVARLGPEAQAWAEEESKKINAAYGFLRARGLV